MRHYALTRFSSLPPISHQALRGVELRTPDFKYPPGQWAERKREPPVPVIKVLKLEVLDYQVKAGAALCEDRGSRHNQPLSFTLMRHLSCPIKGSAPLKT